LKGKPGENRRRKATELPRHHGRNVSGAARFDGQDWLVCSFLNLRLCDEEVEMSEEISTKNSMCFVSCLNIAASGPLRTVAALPWVAVM
jgi:hypothetical protein